LTLLKLVTKGLKLVSLPLNVIKIDPVFEKVIEISIKFAKASNSLVTLVLGEGLHSREHWRAGVIK